jgi:REP element-mobilizing transposase RayT
MKNRKPNRLPSYDYSSHGYYFLTICTDNRIKYFGDVLNNKMILNNCGKIANDYWKNIPNIYAEIEIDQFIVMPNHVHGILIIKNGTGRCPVPTEETRYGLISKIIGAYKSITTRKIQKISNNKFLWQRSFYDHVIRDDNDMLRIQQYIVNNPFKWLLDRNNFESKVPLKKRGIW